jgi:hypothetical protein
MDRACIPVIATLQYSRTPVLLVHTSNGVWMADHLNIVGWIYFGNQESVSGGTGIGILKNWMPSSLRVFSSSLVLTPRILRGSEAP